MEPKGNAGTLNGSRRRTRTRFAWLPKKISNGKWIWLARYRVTASFYED